MYNGHIWQTTFKINCSKNLSLCSGSNVEVLQTQKCEHDNQSSSMPIFCGPHWLNDKRKLEQKLAFESPWWSSLPKKERDRFDVVEEEQFEDFTGWKCKHGGRLRITKRNWLDRKEEWSYGYHWLKLQKMQKMWDKKWFEKPRMFRVKEIWSTSECLEERRVVGGLHWWGKKAKIG